MKTIYPKMSKTWWVIEMGTNLKVTYHLLEAKSKTLSFITFGVLQRACFYHWIFKTLSPEKLIGQVFLCIWDPKEKPRSGRMLFTTTHSIMKSFKLEGHLCSSDLLESSQKHFLLSLSIYRFLSTRIFLIFFLFKIRWLYVFMIFLRSEVLKNILIEESFPFLNNILRGRGRGKRIVVSVGMSPNL